MVKFHELCQIEFRFLEYLCLVNEDILEREDFRALFGDGLRDGIGETIRQI